MNLENAKSGNMNNSTDLESYTRILLNPMDSTPVSIPDDDPTPHALKTLNYNQNLTIVQPNGLFVWPCHSPNIGIRQYGYDPASGTSNYLTTLYPDEDVTQNFIKGRSVAGGLALVANTVSGGAFAVSGALSAIAYNSLPPINTIAPQTLTQYKMDNISVLGSVPSAEGIIAVAPLTDTRRYRYFSSRTPNVQGTPNEVVTGGPDNFRTQFEWETGTTYTAAANTTILFDSQVTPGLLPTPLPWGNYSIDLMVNLDSSGAGASSPVLIVEVTTTSANSATYVPVTTLHDAATAGAAYAGAAWQFNLKYSDYTDAEITRIRVYILDPTAPNWLIISTCFMQFAFEDYYSMNYKEPGIVIAYASVSVGQQMSLNGKQHWEVTPNFNLSRNLPTFYNIDDNLKVEAAMLYLILNYGTHFRFVYPRLDFQRRAGSAAFHPSGQMIVYHASTISQKFLTLLRTMGQHLGRPAIGALGMGIGAALGNPALGIYAANAGLSLYDGWRGTAPNLPPYRADTEPRLGYRASTINVENSSAGSDCHSTHTEIQGDPCVIDHIEYIKRKMELIDICIRESIPPSEGLRFMFGPNAILPSDSITKEEAIDANLRHDLPSFDWDSFTATFTPAKVGGYRASTRKPDKDSQWINVGVAVDETAPKMKADTGKADKKPPKKYMPYITADLLKRGRSTAESDELIKSLGAHIENLDKKIALQAMKKAPQVNLPPVHVYKKTTVGEVDWEEDVMPNLNSTFHTQIAVSTLDGPSRVTISKPLHIPDDVEPSDHANQHEDPSIVTFKLAALCTNPPVSMAFDWFTCDETYMVDQTDLDEAKVGSYIVYMLGEPRQPWMFKKHPDSTWKCLPKNGQLAPGLWDSEEWVDLTFCDESDVLAGPGPILFTEDCNYRLHSGGYRASSKTSFTAALQKRLAGKGEPSIAVALAPEVEVMPYEVIPPREQMGQEKTQAITRPGKVSKNSVLKLIKDRYKFIFSTATMPLVDNDENGIGAWITISEKPVSLKGKVSVYNRTLPVADARVHFDKHLVDPFMNLEEFSSMYPPLWTGDMYVTCVPWNGIPEEVAGESWHVPFMLAWVLSPDSIITSGSVSGAAVTSIQPKASLGLELDRLTFFINPVKEECDALNSLLVQSGANLSIRSYGQRYAIGPPVAFLCVDLPHQQFLSVITMLMNESMLALLSGVTPTSTAGVTTTATAEGHAALEKNSNPEQKVVRGDRTKLFLFDPDDEYEEETGVTRVSPAMIDELTDEYQEYNVPNFNETKFRARYDNQNYGTLAAFIMQADDFVKRAKNKGKVKKTGGGKQLQEQGVKKTQRKTPVAGGSSQAIFARFKK